MNDQNDDKITHRPWGYYKILADTDKYKVKEIVVYPGKRLSYQYHFKRSEHWTVIEGTLTVVLNDKQIEKYPGQDIFIDVKDKHRACNFSDKNVTFVEVQTGSYFGEDDIVRIQDDYGR